MKLSRLGEFGLIERLRQSAIKSRDVRLGIGDDAAWVRAKSDSWLVTADLLLEGIHFDLQWISFHDLGYKSLAVNLSDIAAMGGVPAYLILSLGIPAHFDSAQIEDFYRGVKSLAAVSKIALIGGDTSVANSLVISVCVIGHAPYRPISRGGARVADDIYVTGTLGDSALGLELLKTKPFRRLKGVAPQLFERHRRPTPRLAAGALLARKQLATAMIDLSDGLLQDLGHICKASGVGARIWEEKLPISAAYKEAAAKAGKRYALSGGEDYELLFCARPIDRDRVQKVGRQARVLVTRIGTCVPARHGISVLDLSGKARKPSTRGHDHFKAQSPASGSQSPVNLRIRTQPL